MNIREYISSGILELYVAGALSEAESREVSRVLREFPEVREEVEEIEKAIMSLSGKMAPSDARSVLLSLKGQLALQDAKRRIRSRMNWTVYLGWAASFILLIGLFMLFQKNQVLRSEVTSLQIERNQFQKTLVDARNDAEKTRELLTILRNKDILRVPLQGQKVAPHADVIAYFDKEKNDLYIDAKDLPVPPRGMVYQVWSLKMNPLVPTSIGLLDKFEDNKDRIFSLKNANSSEGFGITLEPEGGSETPTMERLYSLGTVAP